MSKATPHCSKRLSARVLAALGIVLAVSWGPLSHTLRLVETRHNGEQSFRIVLASDCPFERLQTATQKNAPKPGANSEKKTTERLLNVVPDTLESAQTIHFDLGAMPIVENVSAWTAVPVRHDAEHSVWQPASFDIETGSARGPPVI